MKNWIKLIFIALLLQQPILLKAQRNNEKKEKIKSLKVAFITKELNLSPKEAQTFWPVYNEYQDKLEEMRKSRKKENKIMFNDSTWTDKDANIFIDNECDFKISEAQLQKQYYTQFKQTLSVKKAALLLKAEEDFKRELLRQLKGKNKN